MANGMSSVTTSSEATNSGLAPEARRAVAWIGGSAGELEWTRHRIADVADLIDVGTPEECQSLGDPVAGPWPAVVAFATTTPGRWTLSDAVRVSRRWPLAPLVSVCTELAEGRRRSGPPLPGVEEVAWNEFPARLVAWLADLDAGRPGVLGLPAAARREDRVLEAATRLQPAACGEGEPLRVSVAARVMVDLEGTAALLTAAGTTVVQRSVGRPRLDAAADLIVWDVGLIDAETLTWLGMLAAHRPSRPVVLLESFPRGETTLAAIRAGAAAVLGRPMSLEALAGTLVRLKEARSTGL
jgi:CheY-like chemotaxis protein